MLRKSKQNSNFFLQAWYLWCCGNLWSFKSESVAAGGTSRLSILFLTMHLGNAWEAPELLVQTPRTIRALIKSDTKHINAQNAIIRHNARFILGCTPAPPTGKIHLHKYKFQSEPPRAHSCPNVHLMISWWDHTWLLMLNWQQLHLHSPMLSKQATPNVAKVWFTCGITTMPGRASSLHPLASFSSRQHVTSPNNAFFGFSGTSAITYIENDKLVVCYSRSVLVQDSEHQHVPLS